MKFKKIAVLALVLMCASSLVAPKRSEALVLGLVSGNTPLAIAGGLIAWPGIAVGMGIGYGAGYLIAPKSGEDARDIGAGIGAGAFVIAGVILDDKGTPTAMNINIDVVEKVGALQRYSSEKIETIKNDVSLIDTYIETKKPVKISLRGLARVSDVQSPSYQKKYQQVVNKTALALSERINKERHEKGLEEIQISPVTVQFIFSMNGITS